MWQMRNAIIYNYKQPVKLVYWTVYLLINQLQIIIARGIITLIRRLRRSFHSQNSYRFYVNSCNVLSSKMIGFIHCVQKKTPTHIFDYNSGVSWSIFILFVPIETEMNTLQFAYLIP